MSTAFERLVAKIENGGDKWLPLSVHSADCCGVMRHLMLNWLPESVRRFLCENIGQGLDETGVVEVACALAALHDIGKASMLFQSRITEQADKLRSELIEAGLDVPDADDGDYVYAMELPHAAAGEVLLLINGCPLSAASVIGAHHGKPWCDGEGAADNMPGGNMSIWDDRRANCLWGNKKRRQGWRVVQSECLEKLLALSEFASPSELPELSEEAAMLLTGLVIMADWISSNTAYFPLLPYNEYKCPDERERLNHGIELINLPPAWEPAEGGNVEETSLRNFGFLPNEVQSALAKIIENSKEPGLVILEAPMGMGKTEAALLTSELLARRGAGGIFFGLPTQATANAIFERFIDWISAQPLQNKVSIRLAHGMASLNESFRALMEHSGKADIDADGSVMDRLIAHDWFQGRKQAMLSNFVVGTVDQLLMAALKQKHVMLRHLGLSGKTIIIDECHAYDAYMSVYLNTALSWLGKYKTPVIMLSATLPASSRAEFTAAYLGKRVKDVSLPCDKMAYPLITWTDGANIHQLAPKYNVKRREVKIERVVHDPDDESQLAAVIEILNKELADGGCAALVVNTVKRAQNFARALRKRLSGATVLLMHSRFTVADRLKREKELLVRLGKASTQSERDRVIIVGTQVIEQSLDFDADLMISDLCPADLLVQRIGRLHRHDIHDAMRPERLRQPKCYVLCANDKLESGAMAVYGEYLLMRTRSFLPDTLMLPDGISKLVQEVYDEDCSMPECPKGYDEAKSIAVNKLSCMKREARAFKIHGPDNGEGFGRLLEGDIGTKDEERAKAQVRYGEMTIDALVLKRADGGALTSPTTDGDTEWLTDTVPSVEESRKLLSCRVCLPSSLSHALLRQVGECRDTLPEKWRQSPWLRNMYLIVLDEALTAAVGNCRLSYNSEYGLEWEEEKSN